MLNMLITILVNFHYVLPIESKISCSVSTIFSINPHIGLLIDYIVIENLNEKKYYLEFIITIALSDIEFLKFT